MKFRERSPRPFHLGTELRILAVGLVAVAVAALVLHQSAAVGPAEVGGAALIVVAVSAVNIVHGLVRSRRAVDVMEH